MNLNEGFQTEEELLALKREANIGNEFEEVTVDDVPDLTEETQVLAALESAFRDLDYVREDIRRSGGMSQAIALEADKVIEGFLNENMAVGYFSKHPSATQLRYAYEEFSNKEYGIMAAVIAAALAIAYKLYQWLTKGKSEGGGSSTAGMSDSDLKAVATEREKGSEEAIEAVHQYDKEVPREYSIDELVSQVARNDPNSRSAKATLKVDGLMADLLSHDSMVYKKINSLLNSGELSNHIGLLLDVVKRLHVLAGDNMFNMNEHVYQQSRKELKKIVDGTHFAKSRVLYTLRYEGKEADTATISNDLRDTINTLRSGGLKQINKFSDALKNYIAISHDRNIERFIRLRDEQKDLMEEMVKYLEFAEKRVKTGHGTVTNPDNGDSFEMNSSFDKEFRDIYLDLIRAFKAEQANIASIFKVIENVIYDYCIAIEKIFSGVIREAAHELRELKKSLANSKNPRDSERAAELEKFIDIFDKEFPPKRNFWNQPIR